MIIENICCIGAGYVGGPTMAVIADKCPNIKVNVVDLNEKRIDAWNSQDLSKLPIYETGLDSIVGRARGKNLFFSTNLIESIKRADMIFISVNTPTKKKGIGSGEASDLCWVEKCARDVAKYSKGHTIVVEKSTIPVKTSETIKSILKSVKNSLNNDEKTFSVLSNPEFLSEGNAIHDLEKPDRVLIGGDNDEAIESLAKIYRSWIKPEKIIKTNLWSSELSKLAANAFLAQRVSSINSLSAFCEETGANIVEVSKAIGLDNRIGENFLNSGPGFGGSCFKKDILNLVYLSKNLGLDNVASYWQSVLTINDWQQNRISKIIVSKLFGNITNKNIAILGFSFKANTNDFRESPAIKICRDLLDEGAILKIHDPKVDRKDIEKVLSRKYDEINDFKNKNSNNEWGHIIVEDNINSIFVDTHAVVILTEWEEFNHIDWEKNIKNMIPPSWIFDTRNIINPVDFKFDNCKLWKLGMGTIDK